MKKTWFALVLVFPLLGVPACARAQTACPQGGAPGSAACGPTGASMFGSGAVYIRTIPQVKRHQKSTWGAFAKDRARLVVGASNGLLSERGARRNAERRCRKLGGRDCEVTLTFRDSCAVIALPVEIADGMVIHEASAATVEEASRLGLAACEADSGAGTCRIGYSNCTDPYFVY